MSDIEEGAIVEVQGSGSSVYQLKNVGGVYSCTCRAWNFQSLPIERRTCKHLKAYRGEQVELDRVGIAAAAPRRAPAKKQATGQSVNTPAPALLLAHKWEDTPVDGWWMSEKLDGVRAYWDGKHFISRQGNYFFAPDWFVENLPDLPLDGELWAGRKRFQRTVSIARRQDKNDDWRELRYVVFDAPAIDKPFEQRMDFLKQCFARLKPPYGAVCEHVRCEHTAHLKEELQRVQTMGGEGLMIRRPGSLYETGRSSTLFKIKNFFDAEARVLAHLPGTGRHQGRLGALQVELPNGVTFSVGSGFSDAEREDPPPLDSIVTFRFQEMTKTGVPRFPTYVGVRIDLAWEQVSWPPGELHTGEASNHRDHDPIADLSKRKI